MFAVDNSELFKHGAGFRWVWSLSSSSSTRSAGSTTSPERRPRPALSTITELPWSIPFTPATRRTPLCLRLSSLSEVERRWLDFFSLDSSFVMSLFPNVRSLYCNITIESICSSPSRLVSFESSSRKMKYLKMDSQTLSGHKYRF